MRPERAVTVGDVAVATGAATLVTLVGSCVAVCLWDPVARIGGMNHFLLADAPAGAGDDARFGPGAMVALFEAMTAAGADVRRLRAKCFGGAHVLDGVAAADGVPLRNAAFALAALARAGVPVVAQDFGGRLARRVRFHTDTGQVVVTRHRAAAVEHRRAVGERAAGQAR
jgi:chemotaxis receptor (MCP) glutamine deamidase CheD